MALRKLFIVIDCIDDVEKEALQNTCNEISNMRVLKGSDIVSMIPVFNRNKEDLLQLFQMVKQGGAKSLLSVKGASILAKLAKK